MMIVTRMRTARRVKVEHTEQKGTPEVRWARSVAREEGAAPLCLHLHRPSQKQP